MTPQKSAACQISSFSLIENFKVDQLVQTFPFFSGWRHFNKLRKKEVYFSLRYLIILTKIGVIVENVMVEKINENQIQI